MKRIILSIIILLFSSYLYPKESQEKSFPHSSENSYCFRCHGNITYTYNNNNLGIEVTKRMNPYFIIDSVPYYKQNHKSFECIDCHSFDYKTFPHDNSLQMEQMPVCIDCHEGDEATASYNFLKINEEFKESVHSTKHSKSFTCWMCHNPHSYKINAGHNKDIEKTIIYDNNICLSCHAGINKYKLITSKEKPNIIKSHDWLPNQNAHFAHVRCIECHAKTTNDVLVAHQIQAKEKAVKKCVECHSQNSMLMASLYKFKIKESRNLLGFSNAAILDDSYLIGANRNYYLNIISGLIFGFVILVVVIHAILRILVK